MSTNAGDKCLEFLQLNGYVTPDGSRRLNFFNGNFYIHDGKKWVKQDSDFFHRHVLRFIQNNPAFLPDSRDSVVNYFIKNLQAKCEVVDYVPGTYLGVKTDPNITYFPMENGILRMDHSPQTVSIIRLPHSHKFLCTHVLPYNYEPRSSCPIFLKLINEILEPEKVLLFQEWLGYCLTSRTDLEVLMLLHGIGANGKSVLLLITRLLLGKHNVSSVRLEDLFRDQYSIIETEGKLVNMADEVAKGTLLPAASVKDFTSGGYFYAKQKYKTAYVFKATAKLMYACNHLPRFDDDSNGTTRRLLVITLNRQFLDPAKQNTNYKKEEFWNPELPGIFNWALEGLNRLTINKKFHIPFEVKEAVNAYDHDSNPFKIFLKETVVPDRESDIAKPELYQRYKAFCRENGYRSIDSGEFSKNVISYFNSKVYASENAVRRNKKRVHVYYGLRYIKDDPVEEAVLRASNTSSHVSHALKLSQMTLSFGQNLLHDPKRGD
ncbi:MAG: phage/plasmid primase, P4 family [Bacteriovoracaceae bacterium]|nr:phage/plasmid primase, P4 family [Bacteriovoracaceae bacterium]